MITMRLPCGLPFMIDESHYDLVSNYRWFSIKYKNTSYVATTIYRPNKKTIRLHRLLTGAKKGELVDHIDGNGLNNTKENLRLATRSQNMMNRSKSSKTISNFKGVVPYKNKWVAQIGHNKKTYNLGIFDNEFMAAIAYDRAAMEKFGEYAKTNLPEVN